MSLNLFISYSRQESPFADSLLDELEDRGFKVWMDYQSLTPAKPWVEEIYRGIEEADVILLIVSKAVMVSKFAAAEMETAFELKKRIVLLIFEATELPPWLQHYEWIDFRRSFTKGLNELVQQLQSPRVMPPGPPEKGFAAPWVVWFSFLVSLAVCSVSLFSFWTLYIPYFLVPLPYRILKRDFSFFHVLLALFLLPFALIMSVGVIPGQSDSLTLFDAYWIFSTLLSLVLAPLLFLLLRSKAMRRWGKPIAVRPRFANRQIPRVLHPRPITFTVDAAPEDFRYNHDLTKGMEKYGHRFVAEAEAEVAFVLISRYKTATTLNPEARIVYPVLIQSTGAIDPKMERVQWIDFRRGLRNLDALAQLIPEPTKIFKALGIAPMGNQTVLPPIIRALVIYLIVLGIFTFGGWATSMLQLSHIISWKEVLGSVIWLLIILGSIYFATNSLLHRKGGVASPLYLLPVLMLGIGWSVLFLNSQTFQVKSSVSNKEDDLRGAVMLASLFIYVTGLMVLTPAALWYWKDFRRWCPQRHKRKRGPAPQR